MKNGELISKKIQFIWQDKRKYKTRLFISAFATFSMCFTFLFFGPIELTAFGQDSLTFGVSDILLIMAGVAITFFVVITLLISVLHGKIFNYAVTAIFSLTLCGYIQGNFLNGQLGALTGDEIAWHTQKMGMMLNVLIWIVLFIIPYVVLFFHKKGWKNMIYFVSSALVIMQVVALITVFINAPSAQEDTESDQYLTTNDMFQYSQKDNTLVFLLDRLDYDYINQILADDPHFFDGMDGFTNYTNAISEYARTRPAANFMLTNNDDLAFKVPAKKYFEDSWNQNKKNILKDIHDAGYKADVYTQISDMFGSGHTVEKYVSNMSKDNKKLKVKGVATELINLSVYRYAPTSMKPFFWTYTDYVNKNVYEKSKENVRYEIDETKYFKGINNFNINKKDKYFKFYHFNGSHPPYILNENGQKVSKPTTVLQQTKGSFRILFDAFQKMKELGIYKDASIIIVADHGYAVNDREPLKKATRIGLFYKPSGSAKTALKSSKAPVSLKNIPATILKNSGIDYAQYGKSLDEINENDTIVRKFYKTVMKGSHEKELYTYEITGDASHFKNWKKVNVSPIEFPYY